MEKWKGGKWETGCAGKVKSKSTTNLELNVDFNPPEQSPGWQLKLCQSKMSNWRAHTHTQKYTHTRTRTHTWTLYKIVHKRATKGQNRAKNRSKSFGEQLLVTINYMQQFKKKKPKRRNETKAERQRNQRVNNKAAQWNGCQIKHLRELRIKRDWDLDRDSASTSTSEAHHWHVAKKKTRRILSFGNAAYTHTHKHTHIWGCVCSTYLQVEIAERMGQIPMCLALYCNPFK